jgi:hypothetical protein
MGATTSTTNAPAVSSKTNYIARITKPLDDFFNKHLAPRSVTYQNIRQINRGRFMFKVAVLLITTAYLAFAVFLVTGVTIYA